MELTKPILIPLRRAIGTIPCRGISLFAVLLFCAAQISGNVLRLTTGAREGYSTRSAIRSLELIRQQNRKGWQVASQVSRRQNPVTLLRSVEQNLALTISPLPAGGLGSFAHQRTRTTPMVFLDGTTVLEFVRSNFLDGTTVLETTT